MAHHAYFVVGETEEGIQAAHSFAERELGLQTLANPDVMTLRHGLLSVDDARKLRMLAELAPAAGTRKVLVISASRLFHEAQNALLKLFEEPPAGTHLVLVIPAEGMLLPTLRSRLQLLPKQGEVTDSSPNASISTDAQEFIHASKSEREKMLSKLVERSKSDKDQEKQDARLKAITLLEGLSTVTYTKWKEEKGTNKDSYKSFLDDLTTFIPILHERSAPLKLIFEHMLLVNPL